MRLPNFGYHLARAKGRVLRRIYTALLPLIVRRRVRSQRTLDIDVFAYSNEDMLPEQIRSIRSFLRHAGRPRSFTVVSDGSHTERSIRLLTQVDATVTVRPVPKPPIDLPEKFRDYLISHPTGKQLALIMTLPLNGPTLYTDADVLFFRGASDLLRCIEQPFVPALYLPDCRFSGDERLLRDGAEQQHPVNTGFLVLFARLDWTVAMDRFSQVEDAPNFFTNQTLTHLVLHANGARPLDPAKYIVQLDDQFIYQDRHAGSRLALRHYVNPVRHKFWAHFLR